MLGGQLVAGAARHPYHQGHLRLAAEHVADLRRVVDDLVVRDQREVDGHHLHHRAKAEHRGADGAAYYHLLGDRGVDDSLSAEPIKEPFGDAIGATELADVLADQVHGVVALHLLGQRLTKRDAVKLLLCRHQRGFPRSSGLSSHSPLQTYLYRSPTL